MRLRFFIALTCGLRMAQGLRLMKRAFCILLAWILAILSFPALVGAEPEKSVIQIFTFSSAPSWDAPWRFEPVRRGSGSGFVLKGKRIMTNAHVVSWARQILVRRYQDPRPFLARVLYIGHDCDLAILSVDDESFFDGLEPLEIGELPKVRSTVVTYGYPAGGEQISYTRGVVSRIEVQNYVHPGNRSLLACQTDAAINPGNSGGPVIQNDLVVGVAFQGTHALENTGFFIPPPILKHFLKDIEDGKYDGFPYLGVRLAPLLNPAHRRALKLAADGKGARVDGFLGVPSSEKVLREDDVILQIGDYEVGGDGTIVYQGNRLHLTAAVHDAQHGDTIKLRVWRRGAETNVLLQVFAFDGDRARGNQYDRLPRYYIYGGLVFTPLSLDYLKTFGSRWSDAANVELVYELLFKQFESPETARAEPVVMANLLADPVNASFAVKGRVLVDKINGKRIERLEDVIGAIETCTNAQHVLEFMPHGTLECLDRAAAEKANARILQTYGVPKDRRL